MRGLEIRDRGTAEVQGTLNFDLHAVWLIIMYCEVQGTLNFSWQLQVHSANNVHDETIDNYATRSEIRLYAPITFRQLFFSVVSRDVLCPLP